MDFFSVNHAAFRRPEDSATRLRNPADSLGEPPLNLCPKNSKQITAKKIHLIYFLYIFASCLLASLFD